MPVNFSYLLLNHPMIRFHFIAIVIVGASAFSPRSLSATEATQLQIINGSKEVIDVFWQASDSKRVPNCSIEPGKSESIHTTLGNRFIVVGREDKVERTVTYKVPIQGFRFDPAGKDGIPVYYTQRQRVRGFPIVASAKVNPYALKEAAYICGLMLAKRPDVLDAMTQSGAQLAILAHDEFTCDLPECASYANELVPDFEAFPARDFWDARARGTGGSETDPFATCAEENLLSYPGDPYSSENILIHEFAHSIHLRGLNNVDPTFDVRLREAYDAAMKAGLWKTKYASVNHYEYFAEGVQSWFDNNREPDHDHNHVNTRTELIEYDPALAALCREVFADTEVRYTKAPTRLIDHMAGYDPTTAPLFVWPERLNAVKAAIRANAKKRK